MDEIEDQPQAAEAGPKKRRRKQPDAVRVDDSPPGGRSSQRREQQRSVDTRLAILEASLAEFAEKGFEGASTRNIGERAGLHYTLITYHFRNKDMLWRATAEHFFSEITAMWDADAPEEVPAEPIDRIRHEFRALLRFELKHPDFHQFMVRESREDSPRFVWLMETFLAPVMRRVAPQIEAAQAQGELPPGNPVLLYYLLIGIISVPGALGAEIRYNSGVSPSDPEVTDAYWTLVEQLIFKRRLYDRGA
jgi:AcrR family transcriptional regulator